MAGDEEPVSMAERDAVKRIQAQPDPFVVLRMHACQIREVAARVATLDRVTAVAADVDPDAVALRETIEQQRLTGATLFVRWLVTARGWTKRQFERYVVETLSALLLDESAVRTPSVTPDSLRFHRGSS
jgi:hypothetical protein